MKTTPGLELDNMLQRDWIDGIAGYIFFQEVQQYMKRIEAAHGLATTQGVLIAEPDPIKFATAFFACIHAGVPLILANPKWQRSEWEQLRRQVNPAIVFGNAGIFEVRGSSKMNYPRSGTILIPTGGSSGRLKLAVHTWETLLAACEGFHLFMGSGPIHCCCVLQMYHVSGLMQLMRSFVSGGQIVFTDYRRLEAGQFPEIAAEKLCLSLVPTQLQRLLEEQAEWLGNLRAIFLGGAPMSPQLAACARELRLPVIPTYGMTETAAMITALPAKEFLSGNTGVGHPLKHVTIQVVREDGSLCLSEETGRIQIQADSLCLGYHEFPSNILEDGYLSSDEGYLDQKGRLHIAGRSDRLIVSGGEKIDPLEVETAFLNMSTVREALAVGWPDPEWGERLVVFYVPTNGIGNIDIEDLCQRLRAQLVNYKIPRQIIQVEQLPLTIHGKPDRTLMKTLLKKDI